MKKVITYGTFDLLHVGHINLLRRADKHWEIILLLYVLPMNLTLEKERKPIILLKTERQSWKQSAM